VKISQRFVAFSEYINFKDQEISKAIDGVLNSSKKRTKNHHPEPLLFKNSG
jgi:hypothetical protein